MGTTFLASSAKAQQELGWQTRPLEDGFRETFAHIAASRQPILAATPQQKKAAALITGAALGLLLWQRRNRSR
ncbi:MAG: hypothetical protein R6V73_13205 [Anaerolineales bacterium]